jgi:inosine/xanthosine triphosphatase
MRLAEVAVGSENPAKIKAVRKIFPVVVGWNTESGVSAQPMSDEETRTGALNRARACVKEGAVVGIGLEGGVMESEGGLLSVNWGALVDREGREVVASGARYPLPKEIAEEVRSGKELGDVMDAYTSRSDVRTKEGAVGIFTNGRMTRSELYIHIVRLLAGQYEFMKKDAT